MVEAGIVKSPSEGIPAKAGTPATTDDQCTNCGLCCVPFPNGVCGRCGAPIDSARVRATSHVAAVTYWPETTT